MAKKRKFRDRVEERDNEDAEQQIKSISDLFASSSTDPALEALFKHNAGPLPPLKKSKPQPYDFVEQSLTDDPVDEPAPLEDPTAEPEIEPEVSTATDSKKKSKKRKRKAEQDEVNAQELESRYLNKLSAKLSKHETPKEATPPTQPMEDVAEANPEDEPEDDSVLQHEALSTDPTDTDKTLFISNLPVKASTSKPHLRALKHLFSTHGQIVSIRFRSIAFTDLVPRKVAFITKKMHPERDTCNAYIVYSSAESVAAAVRALNGHVWEGKHLRVDSVAYPTVHDHKRCVFVGNLPFDVQDEELYTHFERCGEIEFVRIVRDKKTNIGKGFGYVQFTDRDAVDKAVLLNDKPSETMKRKLRVTYAKREQKTEVKGNVAAARVRLQKKQKRHEGEKSKVVEGNRAKKDKSGSSGFKIRKKHGKMRLLETK